MGAERLTGWITRFASRNVGIEAAPHAVTLTGGDGTTADLEVPFAPTPDQQGRYCELGGGQGTCGFRTTADAAAQSFTLPGKHRPQHMPA